MKRTHGLSHRGDKAYETWCRIIGRCGNPKGQFWERYGGRGIKVCRRWGMSFEAFLEDMGEPPTPRHSIDRWPNPNGDYKPSNCRWATWKEQADNRNRTYMRKYKGETKCVMDWSRELGIPNTSLLRRVRAGMSISKALAHWKAGKTLPVSSYPPYNQRKDADVVLALGVAA